MKKNTKNEESELETVPKRGQGLWSEPVLGLIIWGKLQLPGTQDHSTFVGNFQKCHMMCS
jgi:hypothetical protein